MVLHIHTDGGSRGNPGLAAVGVVVEEENGKMMYEYSARIGIATNNVAEYRAVVSAFDYLNSLPAPITRINFFLDSKLVVEQLNGNYQIKHEQLKPLFMQIQAYRKNFPFPITFSHVPREQNKQADRLVNLALDNQ